MKKYLAFDAVNGDHEEFETIKEAQNYLEEIFIDVEQGYADETELCKIYELKQFVKLETIDSKENYKYECIDDVPDDENIDEETDIWPYDNSFDKIAKHKFIDINKQ